MERKLVDYWKQGVGWRWSQLQKTLHATQMVLLASEVLWPESDLRDKMGWMANGGKFSVISTYKLACGWFEEWDWIGWKLMWKMKVPQRVNVFCVGYDA